LPIPFRCIGTDLVSGKAFVFKEGPLGEALRATMSLPGVFPPVRQGGTIYADGGLMDNLPVDVVKQMGSNLVIAVNLNISPFNPEGNQSLVSVLNRSVSAMITVNERRSMELADIVISAELQGFTGNDYAELEKIIAKGYAAAAANSSALAGLSLSEAGWQQYVAARESRRIQSVPTPDFVQVVGVKGPLARDIEKTLADNAGKPVDTKRLEKQVNELAGYGRV
jgi:NTE family protein